MAHNGLWRPGHLPGHWRSNQRGDCYGGPVRFRNDLKEFYTERDAVAKEHGHDYAPFTTLVPCIDHDLMGPLERGMPIKGKSPGWDYDKGDWKDRSPVMWVPRVLERGKAYNARRNQYMLDMACSGGAKPYIKGHWGKWADPEFRKWRVEKNPSAWMVDPIEQAEKGAAYAFSKCGSPGKTAARREKDTRNEETEGLYVSAEDLFGDGSAE